MKIIKWKGKLMKEGTCPKCNSDNTEYMCGAEYDDTQMWYEAECKDCETLYQEIYEVKYSHSEITEKE